MPKSDKSIKDGNVFKRLKPYYVYLFQVKWSFVAGVLGSLLYSISSGLGIPMMAKTVFPIIFNAEAAVDINQVDQWRESAPAWSHGLLAPFFNLADTFFGYLTSLPADKLLLACIIAIPGVMMLRSIGAFISGYYINYCGLRVSEGIRLKVFGHIQEMPLAFFHKYKSGDLLARVTTDTEGIKKVVVNVSNDLIRQPATLFFAIVALVVLAVKDPSFGYALLGACIAPVLIFPIRLIGKRISRKAKAVAKQGGELSALLTESIQSPLEIRSYNLQESQQKMLSVRIREILTQTMKQVKYGLLMTPLIEVVAAGSLAYALYVGATKGMDLGSFLGLAAALYMAYEPIKKLGVIHGLLKTVEAPLDRLEAILEEENMVPESGSPVSLPDLFEPRVEITNGHFAYNEGKVALNDLNLLVEPGEIVALVGPSGSGKTTFLNLIPRFYDLNEGVLKVGGINVKNFSKKDLRQKIGLVPQMPTLFNTSVAENIRLGKPSASHEQIVEAAKLAFAHDFIMQMENGYDTIVSERGSSVSGGQRQRLAIARAFLKDAPILLLDEATSALDQESEEKITAALETLMKGKTVFMIAHRESSLKSATRRLIFKSGEMVSDSRGHL